MLVHLRNSQFSCGSENESRIRSVIKLFYNCRNHSFIIRFFFPLFLKVDFTPVPVPYTRILTTPTRFCYAARLYWNVVSFFVVSLKLDWNRSPSLVAFWTYTGFVSLLNPYRITIDLFHYNAKIMVRLQKNVRPKTCFLGTHSKQLGWHTLKRKSNMLWNFAV